MKNLLHFIFVSLLLLSLALSSVDSLAKNSQPRSNSSEYDEGTLKLLEVFGEVFEKARRGYVEEVSDKELIESAINGMLSGLDPHSAYLNKENYEEMQVQTSGEFGGLGIEVTQKNGMIYIVSPIDDTPAYKAGVKAGDYISHLDGESVIGLSLSDAVKKMRGKKGTKITIKIIREGVDEAFDVEITRDIIQIQTVKARLYEDVLYARVSSFSGNTSKDLEKIFHKKLKSFGDISELKGVVLDLRNNPGGLLNEAVGISDLFLDNGEIVSIGGRDKNSARSFFAKKGDIAQNLPVVVMVNGGSASASEIVAGALQDHGRAVVIGTKSFGKGSVQTIIPTENGGAIRLTTARYYTASGRSIQAKGITPDIIVQNAKLEFLQKQSLRESDLTGHLKQSKQGTKNSHDGGATNKADDSGNDNSPNIDTNHNSNRVKDGGKEGGATEGKIRDGAEATAEGADGISTEQLYIEDYQLARAIDLIRGIYIYKK